MSIETLDMDEEKYSIEDIYKLFGQYDWVATFFFKSNSEAYKKYGPYVTGLVDYTFQERQNLEKKIQSDDYSKTAGNIKLKYLMNDEDEEYVSKLRFDGFHTDEIKRINYLPWERENKFINDEKNKIVPNIIKIPTSDIPNFGSINIESIKMKTFESRFHRDAALLYEEKCEYAGILSAFLGGNFPEKINKYCGLDIDEVQNNPIVYRYYLKTKQKRDGLSIEENVRLIDLEMKHIVENLNVFDEELQSAFGGNFELSQDKELYQFCKDEVAKFEKERLLQIHPMIYWDVRSFCHIYLRHVKETQVGGNSANKSVITYQYDEIKRLIQQVLKSVQNEIEKHYKKNGNKGFKRVGRRAIYFNGEYYYVYIDENGRLESFYPKDRHYKG